MSMLCLHNAKVFTGVAVIENGSVLVNDGLILDVVTQNRLEKMNISTDFEFIEINGNIIAPGFIDTHIHGVKGFDTSNGKKEDFLGISENLTSSGVTSFYPTLYPEKEVELLEIIRNCVSVMGKEKGARINGLHLEGPFVSPKKLGVQRLETISEVDLRFIQVLYKEGRGNISLMTVAPELKMMRDLAHYCTSRGIVLSAGHSDASYENMMEGVQSGILHCTHVFNAMHRLNHREPGLLGVILTHDEISCELIADGVHVHPALIQILLRDKSHRSIVLVTDSIAPTGLLPDVKMVANGDEVYLGGDSVFYRKKDNVMAGSSLTLDHAVCNMMSWGVRCELALRMASGNPATILGKNKEMGYLLPGYRADLVVLDKDMRVIKTYVDGLLKYEVA